MPTGGCYTAFKNTRRLSCLSTQRTICLNRAIAFQNIEKIDPSLCHSKCNSYPERSNLFINKQTIFSQKGTTQGDPLEISMYGIASIPLIELIGDCFIFQKWYADDGNVVGSLDKVKLFDSLKKHGHAFGYHHTKCHIITKEHLFENAFDHNEVEIADGCKVLGSLIGSDNAEMKFVERRLKRQLLENV